MYASPSRRSHGGCAERERRLGPCGGASRGTQGGGSVASRAYHYVLKFLLVRDSDGGKGEILGGTRGRRPGVSFRRPRRFASYRTTTVLLDGKRVRLHLWDTSVQGHFSTIIRLYSSGAQEILIVCDITTRLSFYALGRSLQEVERHAPGVSKVLLGNRLHLAFNREVGRQEAAEYAHKHGMSFFEVSFLCDFYVTESFVELSRMALRRNCMKHLWHSNRVLSLQELCSRFIVSCTSTSHRIEQRLLPPR
ncbi:hypothetical protein HPB48_019788 [Haemaphysalis longicornis]|uniref:SOCS box domain-containing protein n=1 Tax=Haemaphysalis longicornis TaxID=44386 RepID=A0A9J6GRW9_HAELO|nr:hypothetical protein HPB48_019788 [Haemaphysalis longicornis]